jgi:hypothetical protein
VIGVARVFVSAVNGSGLDVLRELIVQAMQPLANEGLNFPLFPPFAGAEQDPEKNLQADADPETAAAHPTQA